MKEPSPIQLALRFAGIAAFGWAWMVLAMPGCGSRLGPVRATQSGGIDQPNLPDLTVERAKECVAEYGSQLEPGHHAFDAHVHVNDEGYKETVSIDEIPLSASDFAACMRNVLRDMPIAEEPFRQGVRELKYRREHPSTEDRSLVGHPMVIVVAGVTIVVSELVLEAGATTILFAVTVKVIDKAKDDVVEALKRRRNPKDTCTDEYEKCMDAPAGDRGGNHWQQSLCGACAAVCARTGKWPPSVGNGSCNYSSGNWGPN